MSSSQLPADGRTGGTQDMASHLAREESEENSASSELNDNDSSIFHEFKEAITQLKKKVLSEVEEHRVRLTQIADTIQAKKANIETLEGDMMGLFAATNMIERFLNNPLLNRQMLEARMKANIELAVIKSDEINKLWHEVKKDKEGFLVAKDRFEKFSDEKEAWCDAQIVSLKAAAAQRLASLNEEEEEKDEEPEPEVRRGMLKRLKEAVEEMPNWKFFLCLILGFVLLWMMAKNGWCEKSSGWCKWDPECTYRW